MSCRLDYGPKRHILVDVKVFAITIVDVYKCVPLLIFNVAIFLNESNHRKCVKRKEKLVLEHMLGFLLAGNKCPNVIAYRLTHMLMHVLPHALKFGSKCEPGNNTEPNTKHMSKFDVITTAEWFNIVSFSLIQEVKPNDRKL